MDVATKGRLEAILAVLAILVTLHFAPDARAQQPSPQVYVGQCWPKTVVFAEMMWQTWNYVEIGRGLANPPEPIAGTEGVVGEYPPVGRLWMTVATAWAYSYRMPDGQECIIDTGPRWIFRIAPPMRGQPTSEEQHAP